MCSLQKIIFKIRVHVSDMTDSSTVNYLIVKNWYTLITICKICLPVYFFKKNLNVGLFNFHGGIL